MIDGPRDLGVDPVTGERRLDWKWINEQVAKTSRLTDIDIAEHAARVEARYVGAPSISTLAILKILLGR